MAKSWTTKYAPESTTDLIGQQKAYQELNKFLVTFKAAKKKAALCYGPPGAGKTSTVYVLAKQHNLEVVEINASDARNASAIEEKIKPALMQQSLFTKGKVVLLDEVDGLSGTKDRGGLPAMLKLVESTKFPIIMTANNPFDHKFSKLRRACVLVQFEEVDYKDVANILSKIAQKEDIKVEETALKTLARRCGGDVRAAINDLQTLSSQTKQLTSKELETLSDRAKTESMKSALIKVFKVSDPSVSIHAFDSVNEDLDKAAQWIDKNLPKEYTEPEALANAYMHLSKADVYKGRIRRWQHWRFLVYINTLLTAGIATAKKERNKTAVDYKESDRGLVIWRANMKYGKRKAIAEKIALKTHTSTKRAIQDTLPYLQEAVKHNPEFASKFQVECDLDNDEMDWLKK